MLRSRAALVLCLAATALGAAPRPNVVFLLADDLGLGDVGFTKAFAAAHGAGNTSYTYNPPRTPNLDAMALSNNSILFKYFYAGSAVCSPTRASLLTGRSPERDCIDNAEGCGQEPAWSCFDDLPLPPSTYTAAEAAQAANYSTLFIGKWHLGNFWAKEGDPRKTRADKLWPASHPGMHGFEQWHATEASASSSTTNCGCEPAWVDEGQGCIIGGGDWERKSLECTNYWSPASGAPSCFNASTVGRDCVSNLTEKIAGDDSAFIMSRLEQFLQGRQASGDGRPFFAMIWLHTNHVPHPSLPQWYHAYNDSLGVPAGDYLGTISQMDAQIATYRSLLARFGADQDTVTFMSADNGAHTEGRSGGQLAASEGLRQCKASLFEGGIREPGFVHWPAGIAKHTVARTAASTLDILATFQDLAGAPAANPHPSWATDGVSLAPLLTGKALPGAPRSKLMPFGQSGQWAILNQSDAATWKLVAKPQRGQCPTFLPPFGKEAHPCDHGCLFELDSDPTEDTDRCTSEPELCASMRAALAEFQASVANSRDNETGCGASAPPSPGAFKLTDGQRCLLLADVSAPHVRPSMGDCSAPGTLWRNEPATSYLASAEAADTCAKAEAENFPVCAAGTPVWTGRCGIGAVPDPDVIFDKATGMLRVSGCESVCAQLPDNQGLLSLGACDASALRLSLAPSL